MVCLYLRFILGAKAFVVVVNEQERVRVITSDNMVVVFHVAPFVMGFICYCIMS